MTYPTWIALWLMLDGGEFLPCSDLPKAVERSFPFLQLWVQVGTDRRHDLSWTSFFLLPLGESLSVLVLQDDVVRNESRVCPCGLRPKVAAHLETHPQRDVPPDAASCSAQRAQKKLYLDIKLWKFQNIFWWLLWVLSREEEKSQMILRGRLAPNWDLYHAECHSL